VPRAGSDVSEAARARLAKWKAQPAFSRYGLWEQRLRDDGMDEGQLLALLDQSPSQGSLAPAPEWLTAIEDALASHDRCGALEAHIAAIQDPTLRAELRLAAPLVSGAFLELRAVIAEEVAQLPCDRDWLEAALFEHLVGRLETPLLRSLSLAVNVARVRGELCGATGEERFADFVEQRVAQGPRAFFDDVPLLARHVLAIGRSWASSSARFLRDLSGDLGSVRERFWGEAAPGRITKLEGGAGDVHRGGRSVIIIHFEDGKRLVYKPHSLAVDVHFSELVAAINRDAAEHDLLDMRAVGTLDRGDHGYAEFVPTRPCSSVEEMTRYFRRQGQHLALMFGLEGIDIHSENVLAHGEYPVIIDLEALFHPRIEHTALADPANRAYTESVLRILFLPDRVQSRDGVVGFDVSALGERSGQTVDAQPLMVELGTDTMHVERQRMPLPSSTQRPTIAGHDVDVMDYLEPVCAGFRAMARHLVSRRDTLLEPGGAVAAFANDEVRVILRNTAYYDSLLRASYHPPNLRDGLDLERLYDYLYQEVAYEPALAQVIGRERADLWEGDIPVFTIDASSTDLVASGGEVIRGVVEKSGYEGVVERLRGLDEAAIDREIWLIRASFATIPLGKGVQHWKSSRLERSARRMSHDELVHRASVVGDRLVALAHRRGGRANWLGLALFGEVEWDLAAVEVGLYDGSLGIALFLGYLARATGRSTYSDLALEALQGARAMTAERVRLGGEEVEGITGGPASFVYVASHLARVLHRPSLAREAEAALGSLAAVLSRPDAHRDVIGGMAGGLYAALAIHATTRSAESLRVARLAADRLAAGALTRADGVAWEPDFSASAPLTGFSHGASGIGLGLARFAALLGEEDARPYRDLALGAVRYEARAASGDNWLDFRTFDLPGPVPPRTMCTWCHGAPGVGFARAGFLSLGLNGEGAIARDLAMAAATTERSGFGLNHSICHGDVGNAELLAVAARALGDDELEAAYQRRLAEIADSIDRMGWSCGVPLGVENPGLFTGIAGIGYGWLRAALPDEVPSLMLLEPPRIGMIANGRP
jgi:type 2 lantibiotic biosynthesis protein LanM